MKVSLILLFVLTSLSGPLNALYKEGLGRVEQKALPGQITYQGFINTIFWQVTREELVSALNTQEDEPVCIYYSSGFTNPQALFVAAENQYKLQQAKARKSTY